MSEILKSLWQRLYAWAFPSALMLGACSLLVYPKTKILHSTLDTTSANEKAIIFVALSGALGFFLFVLSTPLYRILEGYLFWPRCVQEKAIERQLRRKREAENNIATGVGWRHGLALEILAGYPMWDEQVVPTGFGNAIRAFETYGKTRFNLDSLTLWYELCAVVPKYIQTELDSTRSSVDFFVASFYLSAAFGLMTVVIGVCEEFNSSLLLLGIPSFIVTLVSHRMALKAINSWSRSVQALVNLGSVKLADALGLCIPENLDDEKMMWGLLTSYVFLAKVEDGAGLDRFRKKETETREGTNADRQTATARDQRDEGTEAPQENDDETNGA